MQALAVNGSLVWILQVRNYTEAAIIGHCNCIKTTAVLCIVRLQTVSLSRLTPGGQKARAGVTDTEMHYAAETRPR